MTLPPSKRANIEKILGDPRYWDAKHPEHAGVKAAAVQAFRDAYPEPPANSVPASTIHVRAYTRRHNGRIIQVSDYDRTTIARSPASHMSPSDEGRMFLKLNEGFEAAKYQDQAMNDTVGYGHKIRAGESFPNGVTREQAERMFEADIAEAASAVRRLVKVELTQPQFDALVSLVYNVGSGEFAKSRMLRKLNAGDAPGAATEFDDWDNITVDGRRRPARGLTNRRRREKSLFLNGTYR